MRTFAEHLIYERALDAAFADAATKSYEILKKHILTKMSEAWKLLYDNCKVGSPIRNSYTPSSDSDRNAQLLVSEFRSILKGFNRMYFVDEMPTMEILSGDSNPSFLVLPPQVSMDMFRKITFRQSLSVVLVGKIEGAAGTYKTSKETLPAPLRGKKEVSSSAYRYLRHGATEANPRITLGGMKLYYDRFVDLCKYLLAPTTGRNKAYAAIQAFLNHVEANLNENRSVYVHEYTHLLDDLRYKGEYEALNITQGTTAFWASKKDPSVDIKPYHKSDIEWNAYFQMSSGVVRDMVKTYLVAMTSDGLAYRALIGLGKQVPNADNSTVERAFNETPQLKNGLVANALSDYLNAKLTRESKVFGWYRSTRHVPVFGQSRWASTMQQVFTANTGGNVMDAWLEDPKLRRKFIARLYSTAQDLEKLAADYISGLKQGKVPSKGEWTSARERISTNEYNFMYDGALIFAKDAYSPKKQYSFAKVDPLLIGRL